MEIILANNNQKACGHITIEDLQPVVIFMKCENGRIQKERKATNLDKDNKWVDCYFIISFNGKVF
jgi:hypothetical protein